MNHPRKPLATSIALAFGAALAAHPPGTLGQQTQKIEKIEVTGSNIKRIEGETALPVTVITRQDIDMAAQVLAAGLVEA